VDWERVRGAERLGTLGFPSLITGLCAENGIIVDPKVKIRSSIDKKFIEHHCTHPDENPVQRNIPPSPQRSPIRTHRGRSWEEVDAPHSAY